MVRQRLLKSRSSDLKPELEGRELSVQLQDSYRSILNGRRQERLARNGHPRMTLESIRNRVVIQEIRKIYNEMSGIGDHLLDLKLPVLLTSRTRISSLGRKDLEVLNEDLSQLALTIFGQEFAEHARQRIKNVIDLAFR